MVAYSFKNRFEDAIKRGVKKQTIRADRKRHARVGEPVQLYCGMRTRNCRKILTPDPVCIATDVVVIYMWRDHPEITAKVAINGIPVFDHRIERFAELDGFESCQTATARQNMGKFWLLHHGEGRFEGVLIRWEAVD